MSQLPKNCLYLLTVAFICFTSLGIVGCTPQGASAGCTCAQPSMRKACDEKKGCEASTCHHHKKCDDHKKCEHKKCGQTAML